MPGRIDYSSLAMFKFKSDFRNGFKKSKKRDLFQPKLATQSLMEAKDKAEVSAYQPFIDDIK